MFLSGLVRGCTLLMILVILYLLFTLIKGGHSVLSLKFITQMPKEGMTKGGILTPLVGTILLALTMMLMAFPVGFLTGIHLSEFMPSGWISRIIRLTVYLLAGVPSIIFGLFGLAFFIIFIGNRIDLLLGKENLFGKPSLLWAAATLATLVLPIIIVSTTEALKAVPWEFREGSYALGATRTQTTYKVVVPHALPSILTGIVLALSRGAGETAPIMITGAAYYMDRLPNSLLDQFMALPYHVFTMATQSVDIEATLPIQYASSALLILLTITLNLIAITLRILYSQRTGR